MRPLRIAVIVSQFPAIAETFVLNQVTGLLNRGHEVDIVALDGLPRPGKKYHEDVDRYHLLSRVRASESYRISPIRWKRGFQCIGLFLVICRRYPRGCFKLLGDKTRLLSSRLTEAFSFSGRRAYDVVHCQFGDLAHRVLFLRRLGLLQGKFVVSLRGYDLSGYLREKGGAVYRPIMAEADLFLPNCDFFLKRMLSLGCPAHKIRILRSCIRLDKFPYAPKPRLPLECTRILFAGRLVEKKGIEYALQALAMLVQEGRDVSLSVAGDGPLKNELESLAGSLGIANHVCFLGEKTAGEVAALLEESHIFLAPSVTDTKGEEDGPLNTLKEAMATGLPVISTRHGGVPELVEDGTSGFLVPERDAAAIAQKLRWLIDHPDLCRRMGIQGRARVERDYDAEKLNDELAAIYRELNE